MTGKPRAAGTYRAITALACLLYFTSYITRLDYNAALADIVENTSLGKAEAGIASTALFFAYGVGQIASGILGDQTPSAAADTRRPADHGGLQPAAPLLRYRRAHEHRVGGQRPRAGDVLAAALKNTHPLCAEGKIRVVVLSGDHGQPGSHRPHLPARPARHRHAQLAERLLRRRRVRARYDHRLVRGVCRRVPGRSGRHGRCHRRGARHSAGNGRRSRRGSCGNGRGAAGASNVGAVGLRHCRHSHRDSRAGILKRRHHDMGCRRTYPKRSGWKPPCPFS